MFNFYLLKFISSSRLLLKRIKITLWACLIFTY